MLGFREIRKFNSSKIGIPLYFFAVGRFILITRKIFRTNSVMNYPGCKKFYIYFSREAVKVSMLQREFKITTTATETGTSLNKRFNEKNNGSARAL